MNIPASQIAEELKTFCGKHDSQKAAAKALRVTDSQLSMALSGKSNVIPGKILKKLGYVTALAYFKIGEEPSAKKTKKPPTDKSKKVVAKPAKKATKKTAARKTGMPAALGAPYGKSKPVKGDPYKAVAAAAGMPEEPAPAFRNPDASLSPSPVIDMNIRGD